MRCLMVAALSLVLATPVLAGALSGKVYVANESGRYLPAKGAKIELLRGRDVLRSRFADANGYYRFGNVEGGTYDLKVRLHARARPQVHRVVVRATGETVRYVVLR